ncbi:MAG TPA: dynamin family protein [Urbifossiella sp.]|nr:dynamin family protein [Urbifossiella sp.]
MPATPDPLTPADCKLLARYPDRLAPVLADFNAAVETFRALQTKCPKEVETPDVVEAVGKLVEARLKLTTPRFKVGFLGPFQCGKSTILNNLLGQQVAGVGVGKACTSVVTRLIVGEAGKPAEMTVTYFTGEGYRARRNTLCEWLQLKSVATVGELALIEKLKNYVPDGGGVTAARRILPKDKPFLQAFLQSYHDAPKDLVREGTPHVDRFTWTPDRQALLTHAQDQDDTIKPGKHLLVAESSITFPTDRIDPDLEMVDCPGLGAGRSVDDLLTKEYIKELDGALVFLRADSMDSADVGDILSALQAKFRETFRSRVWVVVNKMDAPEQHAKVGTPGQITTWDVMTDLMRRNDIPLSQVCLGCNGIFRAATQTGGEADRSKALTILQLFSPGDEEAVKTRLGATPELAAAFEELLKDGGVSQLGRLIKEKVRPSVAAQILAQTGGIVKQARDELEYARTRCDKPISLQDQNDAMDWYNALLMTALRLSGGREANGLPGGRGPLFTELEALGRDAYDRLRREFGARAPDEVLSQMSVEDLFDQFPFHATRMQATLDAEFDQMVQAAYTKVTAELEARNLPAVTLPGGSDPMAVWHEGRVADRPPDAAWREPLRPQLRGNGFADRMRDKTLAYDFDGLAFKTLFEGKLRTAAQQITLAVRWRLQFRLGALQREVRRKLGTAAPEPATAPAPTP